MKYWFLNISVAKVIKYLPYVVIFGFLLSWFLPFNWWAPATVVLLLTLILFIISIGSITILPEEKKEVIKITTMFGQEFLQGPFTIETWWNYDFQHQNLNLAYNESVVENTSGEIRVFTRLVDANNKSILFKEVIIFGTRFPNDIKYDTNKEVEVIDVFFIQRADKLSKFLIENLTNPRLVNG